jgi:hypothetical protein
MTRRPSAKCAQSLNIAHDFTEPTAVSRTIRTRSGSLSLHKCAGCTQLSSFARTSIHTVSHWFVCPPRPPTGPQHQAHLFVPSRLHQVNNSLPLPVPKPFPNSPPLLCTGPLTSSSLVTLGHSPPAIGGCCSLPSHDWLDIERVLLTLSTLGD